MTVTPDQVVPIKTAWDKEYGLGSWDKFFNAHGTLQYSEIGPGMPVARDDDQIETAWDEDLTAAVSSEHEIQSRNLFSMLAELSHPIGLRDVAPDQLAARNNVDDFIAALFPEHEMQSRNFFSSLLSGLSGVTGIAEQFLPILTHIRDISPEQLASLGNLAARDNVDDFIASLFSEREMQSRNFFSSLLSGLSGVTGIAEQFLPILTHIRDISPEQLASLGKRLFDDLD